jgi:hypothetical protein
MSSPTHDSGESSQHQRTSIRWLEGIAQPVIVALLLGMLGMMLQMHEDMSKVRIHLTLIETTLKLPALPW